MKEDGRVKPMHNVIIDAYNLTLIAAAAAFKADPEDQVEVMGNILMKMLGKLKTKFSSATFYAVWDSYGGTAFRKEIDHNYKSNRTKKIVDFKAVNAMKPLYELYGIKNISIDATEADDVIFLMCKILKERNCQTRNTIVSRDHDLLQAIQAGYAKDQWDVTKKKFIEVPEYNIVNFKSLVGDKSDCIPGVAGIGEKTALKILRGTLKLTEAQRVEYEKYKDMVDSSRHPKFNENYEMLKKII